jgi:hypothetical protein
LDEGLLGVSPCIPARNTLLGELANSAIHIELVLTIVQGAIKHTLNLYRDGKYVTVGENEHANKHCLEVVRHVSQLQYLLTDTNPKSHKR